MGIESVSGARPVLAVAAAGMIVAGCGASGAGSPIRSSPSLRLVAYDDCGQLLGGLRRATAAHVGPYGLGTDPIMRPLPGERVPGDARAPCRPTAPTWTPDRAVRSPVSSSAPRRTSPSPGM